MQYGKVLEKLKSQKNAFNVMNPLSRDRKELLECFAKELKNKTDNDALSFDELMLLGVYHHGKRNYKDALWYFNEASRIDDKNPLPLLNAAHSYEMIKDHDKAESVFEKALRLEPENPGILSAYAVFLDKNKRDLKRAEELFEESIRIDGKNPAVLCNYALFLKEKSDFNRAEEYFKRAIEVDPEYAAALGNYALFLREVREDAGGAEKYFKKAIEADSNYAISLGNYAVFLREGKGDFLKADEYFKRAIEAGPENVVNLGNYSFFLFERQRYEEAMSFLNRLLNIASFDWIYFMKAHVLLGMNKIEEAKKVYEEGLKMVDSLNRLEELIDSDLTFLKEKKVIDDHLVQRLRKSLRNKLISNISGI